jgi:hypothetical protein
VFNPLDHSGIPLERQTRDRRELNVTPIDPEDVESSTRCRVIVMTGIENQAVRLDRHISRVDTDPELLASAEQLRSAEARQRRALAGLLPQPGSILEAALSYERAAVDLDSWLARMEPDPQRRQVYECDALEDFDHVYRYAEVLDLVRPRRAERLVDEVNDVLPDRADAEQAGHRYDEMSAPAQMSKLNALTMLAIEQWMTEFYNTSDVGLVDPPARPVYREVRRVELEQVARHQALVDPATRWERLVLREYNECHLYYSFLQQESDLRVRALWDLHLQMELGQLRLACDLLRRFGGREPEEIVGTGLPEPLGFEGNREFLRRLLATHLDPDTLGASSIRDLPEVREVRERLDNRRSTATAPDVVDVLTDQHTRIEALFYDVEVATDERRRAAFDDLVRLIAAHEAAEEETVHLLARERLPGGFEVIRDLFEEERQAKELLVRLIDHGVEWEDFDDALITLRDAVLTHTRHEERTEFPQLRETVPVEQLRELAATARPFVAV